MLLGCFTTKIVDHVYFFQAFLIRPIYTKLSTNSQSSLKNEIYGSGGAARLSALSFLKQPYEM